MTNGLTTEPQVPDNAASAIYTAAARNLRGKPGVFDGKTFYFIGDTTHMTALADKLREKGDGINILQELGREPQFSIAAANEILRGIDGREKKPDAVVMVFPGVDLLHENVGLPAIAPFVQALDRRGIKAVFDATSHEATSAQIPCAGGTFVRAHGFLEGSFNGVVTALEGLFSPGKAAAK